MAQKILIIDDDRYIRELYEEVLKDAGFEVVVCSDGQDGLSKILANGYDLVLLDVMLPRLDGLGVLDKVSQTPNHPDTPIILLTNLANDPNVEDVIKKSMAKSYLVKSDMTPEEFLGKIKGFLSAP